MPDPLPAAAGLDAAGVWRVRVYGRPRSSVCRPTPAGRGMTSILADKRMLGPSRSRRGLKAAVEWWRQSGSSARARDMTSGSSRPRQAFRRGQ
jgi:hypothetical protein